MPAHTGRLLLTPEDPNRAFDKGLIRAVLADAGFIGAHLPRDDSAFQVGERFLELIVFAGCSVQVAISPSTNSGDPFCYVRLSGPFQQPRLLHGRNSRPPRCRACRAPLEDWKRQLPTNEGGEPARLRCPACGDESYPWSWDWKESAGFGRFFIGVEEIFPGEATPTPGLMATLRRATGTPWRHFYVQDDVAKR
jgi:hypothetical protein